MRMPPTSNNTSRIVIKLGTGILTSADCELNATCIGKFCSQIAQLRKRGVQVILVSSGAVGLGMGRLGIKQRPRKLPELQKCAAVGQSILTETWQQGFRPHDINVAQVLLTGSDIMQPSHNRIFGNFLEEVLSDGIVPVINENDCVSTAGFNLGDNDSLAALLSCRLRADKLIILSTIAGLMDLKTGELITHVERITAEIEALAEGSKSTRSVGGMLTKVRAARLAQSSGCAVFIGDGSLANIILDAVDDKAKGTYFKAAETSGKSRKRLSRRRWRVYFAEPKGSLHVDAGARKALEENGSSLLPRGISSCEGNFTKGDTVDIVDASGTLFARGVSEFDSSELEALVGMHSDAILKNNPSRKKSEAIHRDTLVLLN